MMDDNQLAARCGVLPVHRLEATANATPATDSANSAQAPDSGGDSAVVVAVHGITANGLSFAELAEQLPGRQVWAVDLAGRACAREEQAPFGLSRHADDVISVLEEAHRVTGRPVPLIGHSMGAFVSAVAASRRPDLVSRLVLVDGGLAFPLPPAAAADLDATITAVIGPAMERLSMRFESAQAYLQFWAQHPAIGPLLGQQSATAQRARDYILHDLVQDGDAWRSTCRLDAVRADGADTLTDEETHAAARAAVEAGVPTSLLWAPRGLMNEEQGLYDPDRLAALQLPDALRVERMDDDVNHYTILFAPAAVQRLVAALS